MLIIFCASGNGHSRWSKCWGLSWLLKISLGSTLDINTRFGSPGVVLGGCFFEECFPVYIGWSSWYCSVSKPWWWGYELHIQQLFGQADHLLGISPTYHRKGLLSLPVPDPVLARTYLYDVYLTPSFSQVKESKDMAITLHGPEAGPLPVHSLFGLVGIIYEVSLHGNSLFLAFHIWVFEISFVLLLIWVRPNNNFLFK